MTNTIFGVGPTDEERLIDYLAPAPRWYRFRVVLLVALVTVAIGAVASERWFGLTNPRIGAGASASTSMAEPFGLTLLVTNPGRFDATITGVDELPGVTARVGAEPSKMAMDPTTGDPATTAPLPIAVPAGGAVTLFLTFDDVECAQLDPRLTTVGVNAEPAVGPSRHVDLAAPTTNRNDAPESFSYSGDNPYELGWQAAVFGQVCPELLG